MIRDGMMKSILIPQGRIYLIMEMIKNEGYFTSLQGELSHYSAMLASREETTLFKLSKMSQCVPHVKNSKCWIVK